MSTRKISMKELYEATLNDVGPKDIIVDVRTPEEYAEGHVPKSINYPVDEIASHASKLKNFENVYLYCRSGGRVGVASQILQVSGVSSLHSVLSGGFPNWEAAGYPVEY